MTFKFKLLIMILFMAVLAVPILNTPVFAVEPSEMLKDPVLEKRARVISKGLRCLVCQNQSIDDSNAGLAKDLRILVRKRLTAGDSNEQVVAFVVDRYGDYVLLEPPVKTTTILLWLSPFLIVILALTLGIKFYKRRPLTASNDTAAYKLSQQEEEHLQQALTRYSEQDPKP